MNALKKSFYRSFIVVLVWLFLSVSLVQAATPLVEPAWLMANLGMPGMQIVDLQSAGGFRQAHLPGSVNTDYGQWRVKDHHGTPKMLPGKDYLDKLIGRLGIDNQTYVVLAPVGAGAGDMAMATRVYWTVKAMGHDNISILDGGLIAYSHLPGSHFVREVEVPPAKEFISQVRADYFPDVTAVKAALDQGVVFVDSRSHGEYVGQVGGVRSGTIPGSILLPYDRLVVAGSGRFYALPKLKEIYQASGVPLTGEQISFCHTGHRTSLSWFVSHELLGNKQARLYDGSMIGWAADPALPMEVLSKQ